MNDPIEAFIAAREASIARHNELRRQEPFASQTKRLHRLTMGFCFGLQAMWLMSTRSRKVFDEFLTFRFLDDQLQCSVAILSLASEGQLTSAKREMRYMLEACTKHVYVDLKKMGELFAQKLTYLETDIPRSSVNFVEDFRLYQFSDAQNKEFMNCVRSSYSDLCAYVHRSPKQIEETLRLLHRGVFPAFETGVELERFVQNLLSIYDLILVMHFNALGMSLAEDVFIHVLDDQKKWPFHKTKFVKLLSSAFDYRSNAERQDNGVV